MKKQVFLHTLLVADFSPRFLLARFAMRWNDGSDFTMIFRKQAGLELTASQESESTDYAHVFMGEEKNTTAFVASLKKAE